MSFKPGLRLALYRHVWEQIRVGALSTSTKINELRSLWSYAALAGALVDHSEGQVAERSLRLRSSRQMHRSPDSGRRPHSPSG
jgi:hypothetical protein